ncbi:MAG: NAD-dependent epimerase/dehydratase family protein [Vicinamibacterales bacterium]
MRIFLTGATGYVGSAVLDALLRNGHQVDALVRTPGKAEAISYGAVRPIVGDLAKPDTYAAAAEECDAIIHAAYEPKAAAAVDRAAIDTLLGAASRRAAAGSPATLIYTSGVWVLGHTQGQADEDAPIDPPDLVRWRPEHERLVLSASGGKSLRTIVLRPGIVYGGARGIVGDLIKDALNGLVRVVGTGRNHWPCVYDRDLADLYVRLATHPDAVGTYHANDEADERVDDIVDAIARHAKMRPDIRNVPIEEARAKLGPLADALALDQVVRSPRARALGWAPTLHSVAGNVARLQEEFRTAREAA